MSQDDLLENCRRAFNNKVGFGRRPALIMIDFCQGYFDPDCDLYADVEDALASALRVREAAQSAKIPVILTNVSYHPSAIDGGRFFEKASPLRYFIEGNPMAAFAKGLEPRAEELVVTSNIPAPFSAPRLPPPLPPSGQTACC
jgi:maleamate amidohydrolase